MSNIARTETYIGKPYNFIGSAKTDLILETIGKVYIKRLNLMLPIENIIEKVVATKGKKLSLVIILEDGQLIPLNPYPGDGVFVYDPIKKILYLTYDNEYNIIVYNSEEEVYVKLTGDTMTGLLLIDLLDHTLPPFTVNTNVVVENLNADMIDGKHAEDFLNKEDDFEINGQWSFNNQVLFSNKLSSKSFQLNCNTNGWQLDPQGDLVVRNLTVKGELRECNKPEEEEVIPLFKNDYVTLAICGDYWVDILFKLNSIEYLETGEVTTKEPLVGTVSIEGENIEILLHEFTDNEHISKMVYGYNGFYCILHISDLSGSSVDMIKVGDMFKTYRRGIEVIYFSFVITNIIKNEEGIIEYIVAKTSYNNKLVYGRKTTGCDNVITDSITKDAYSSDINDYSDNNESEEEKNGYYVSDPIDDSLIVRTGSKYYGTSASINISTIHDDGPSISMFKKDKDLPRINSENLNLNIIKNSIESLTLFKMGNLTNLLNNFTSLFTMPNLGTFINPLIAMGAFISEKFKKGYLINNGTVKHYSLGKSECGPTLIYEDGIQLTNDGKIDTASASDIPFGDNVKNYINLMIDAKLNSNKITYQSNSAHVCVKGNPGETTQQTPCYTVYFPAKQALTNVERTVSLFMSYIPNFNSLSKLVLTAPIETFKSNTYIFIQEIREDPSSDNNNKIIPNTLNSYSFEFTVAQCAAYVFAITI